jgi:hypothetical protein
LALTATRQRGQANERRAGEDNLDVVADRGYFNSAEILVGITVTLLKPMTSNAKADGRFGKQDFRYVAEEDVYICPAGEKLAYHYTNEENGLVLHRYWTNARQTCLVKQSCTTAKERRITRWEHEQILDAVQRRLDEHPEKNASGARRASPFGTIKARMGATHFLMKTPTALHVLAYNLTRVMNIMGPRRLIAAMRTKLGEPETASTSHHDAQHGGTARQSCSETTKQPDSAERTS